VGVDDVLGDFFIEQRSIRRKGTLMPIFVGQSIETSRSVPQHTEQIFSPLAGQKRAGLRFSQIGQGTGIPLDALVTEQNTPGPSKSKKWSRANRLRGGTFVFYQVIGRKGRW